MVSDVAIQAREAVCELIATARLTAGDVLVVGCSSSEIGGHKIGSDSNVDTAREVFDAIYKELHERGIFLAAQCCEHLNRAIITERAVALAQRRDIVNVVPQPKAGGSFATCAYKSMEDPVAIEEIRANAGMDIGGTLIGMHLAKVAVPVRLSRKTIGDATLICARCRPKFIGGERAHYDDDLK
ncbi:MAG: TIGR01440 family protein [Oscillospiraceae bacterium]